MKSIVSYPQRGIGGNNSYRGNCSPKLIEDIINQFNLKSLSDYMVGSGTTEDVVKNMNIEGSFYDLNRGFDMLNMDIPEKPENIFWHPPYHNIIKYSDSMYSALDIMDRFGFDPRKSDLSRCPSWDDFVRKMNICVIKQFTALQKGGRMFILMGDIKQKGKLYSMLCNIVKPGTLEQIVIKAQHNCFSDHKDYVGKFIPIIHEYLMILKKDSSLIINFMVTKKGELDIRDSKQATWRDVIVAVMENNGPLTLSDIYKQIEGHKKCKQNSHWKAKIRQVLQSYDCFVKISKGTYSLAA